MAAHYQDPFAAIGVSDFHKQESGPLVSQVPYCTRNVVDESSGLNPRRHVEANQLPYAIGAGSSYSSAVCGKCSPGPTARDLVRFLRLERAVSCNSNLGAIIRQRRSETARKRGDWVKAADVDYIPAVHSLLAIAVAASHCVECEDQWQYQQN